MARNDTSKIKLREAMLLMLYGAHGGYELTYFTRPSEQRMSLPAEIGLDTFGRWLGALQAHLTFVTNEQREFIAKPRMLEKYDSFDDAVEFLYDIGVRA